MRWREVGWTVLLVGLPLSPLFLGPLTHHAIDLWHAHAWWAWVGMVGLTVGEFLDPHPRSMSNRPLAGWVAWIGGWFLLSFVLTITKNGSYDISMMLSVLHLLTALWGYWLVTQLPTSAFPMLWTWVARVGVAMSVYGLLQFFGFDQFFMSVIREGDHAEKVVRNYRVVATVGNPSHFAVYLSLVWPCLLAQSGKQWWGGRLLVVLALLATKSFGGILAASLVTLWWYRQHRRILGLSVLGLLASAAYVGFTHPTFFSLSGRWEHWGLLLDAFKTTLITGGGPGAMLAFSQQITDPSHPLWHWRHAHNEYLQLLLEQGVVGLSLIGWMLLAWGQRFWAHRHHVGVATSGAVFLAFLCNSLYNFPAHLWVTSSLGLVAYGGVYATERTP